MVRAVDPSVRHRCFQQRPQLETRRFRVGPRHVADRLAPAIQQLAAEHADAAVGEPGFAIAVQAAFVIQPEVAAGVMRDLAKPDKINVGALGNMVAQLHVHVIGRFRSDPAWPGPVWGFGARTPYPLHARAQLAERAGALFAAA